MPLITSTSDIPGEFQGFYDRNLLENAMPIIIYDKFGQTRPLPKNMGTRINFKRFGKLPVNTTPLTEGVTPSGKKLSAITIYATMTQYGDYITLTDWVMMTGLDANLLSIGKELLSDQMSETSDILTRNHLLTGTTVRYAGGQTVRTSVASAMTDEDVDSIIRTLENNRAKKITAMFAPDSRTNTVPIRPSYIAITHTDSRYDVEHLTGFISVERYPRQDSLSKFEGELIEIGEVRGLRFLATDQAKIWQGGGVVVASAPTLVAADSTNIDVYGSLVFGRNAYGIIPLQKGNVKNIVKALGSAGTEDPLDQRATSGWKMAKTHKILNEDWMLRWEHGVTSVS